MYAAYAKHLPLEFLLGHVLVGVSPCGSCAGLALLPQTAKLSKNSPNCFKICELI